MVNKLSFSSTKSGENSKLLIGDYCGLFNVVMHAGDTKVLVITHGHESLTMLCQIRMLDTNWITVVGENGAHLTVFHKK